MIIRNRHLAVFLSVLALALGNSLSARAQDPKQMVQQVVTTELTAAKADQTLWLYYEVDRKPNSRVQQWVAQTPKGDLRRVLEENDRRLSEAQQRVRMDGFLRDLGAQAKDRRKQQEDIKQTVELLKLLPEAFLWTCTGNQGPTTTLHFTPDAKFHAPNREARILSGVEGDLLVNSAQHRIVSLKGQLIHEVKFGGGLLGELKAGGNFDIERREIRSGEWQITETHVHFEGHMLLFKSVSEHEDDEKSDFQQLPSSVSFEQAESELLQRDELAKNQQHNPDFASELTPPLAWASQSADWETDHVQEEIQGGLGIWRDSDGWIVCRGCSR